MGQTEKYKNIRKIVAVLVLTTAMTSGLEIKYFRRAPLAIAEKQYWHSVGNVQDLRANIPASLDARTSTRIENKLDRQRSNLQRPSLALIGRTDLPSNDRPSNLRSIMANPKCPSFKISFDLLSSLKQRCKTEQCRNQIEKWSIEKPFYVEEPRWVQIELDYDYAENPPYNFNTEDPFFLSRGKKLLMTRPDAKSESDKSNDDDDDDDDDDVRMKFLDEDATRRTESIDFIQEENRVKKGNGSKRKEERGKTLQLDNRQLEDLVRHFDPIDDPFFLSRGKKLFAGDTLQEVSLNDIESEIVEGKLHEEKKRSVTNELKQSENNEINETGNANTNLSQIKKVNGTSSKHEEAQRVSSRTKRSSCTNFGCTNDDSERTGWIKDTEKSLLDSSYVQRRNKHSDISDLLNEPFFISRGKKASKGIDYESRGTSIDYNESLNSLAVAKGILQRLLDSRRCRTEAREDLARFFTSNVETMTDRGRRSALDDLLRKYDPFYVARGKRMRLYSKNRLSHDFKGIAKR